MYKLRMNTYVYTWLILTSSWTWAAKEEYAWNKDFLGYLQVLPHGTVAHQAPLSMGFAKQEYWSGLPFPPSEDLPDPGLKPRSPALAGRFFTTEPPGKPQEISERVSRYSHTLWLRSLKTYNNPIKVELLMA